MALQLAGLYARLDGLTAIVGIIALVAGLTFRKFFLRKPLPPRPPPSEVEAYGRYRAAVENRRVAAWIDLAVFGGTMLVIEAIAIAAYFLFGFHLPVSSG